ncbi:MAG: transglutaminase-like domain-containing protein [Oscillospiraceae bacterium]|nr:transglutaminase-like domain-containing protein [Oscillospiraceae bacterium]
MKKLFVFASLLILLTACSAIFESDYERISEITDTVKAPVTDGGEQEVSNYSELKESVLNLVRGGSEEGLIRLRNYTGNARNDVDRVCLEVNTEEPIGVYALSFISSDPTQILTVLDVVFTLTFRRTPEQIQSVENIGGPLALERRLLDLMTVFGGEFTFETTLYSEERFDFDRMIRSIYYENPLLAQGFPEYGISLYPETGSVPGSELHRVVEMTFTYPDEADQLLSRARRTESAARSIVNRLPAGLSELEKAVELYRELGEICAFDFELYSTVAEGWMVYPSTYDAFHNGRGLPESFALAYKLLCDYALIPNHVVLGQRGMYEHAWNLIELDGHWYHADLAADIMGGELAFNYFLMTDSMIQDEYRWTRSAYPPAEGGELTVNNEQLTTNNDDEDEDDKDNNDNEWND